MGRVRGLAQVSVLGPHTPMPELFPGFEKKKETEKSLTAPFSYRT